MIAIWKICSELPRGVYSPRARGQKNAGHWIWTSTENISATEHINNRKETC